ncbi:MAG TPA: hypothetical protein DCZ63_15175 [Geobacter sp.]|nr:hypothetical protein [Geobacter sp.]
MSGLTNHAEDLLITFLLTTTAVTRPTAWFVELHDGDPGETGADNKITIADDADYVRKAVTFANPVAGSGQCLNDAQVTWTVASDSPGYQVSHASIWDAVTAGNCLFKGRLQASRTFAANDVQSFNVGEIVGALD